MGKVHIFGVLEGEELINCIGERTT